MIDQISTPKENKLSNLSDKKTPLAQVIEKPIFTIVYVEQKKKKALVTNDRAPAVK